MKTSKTKILLINFGGLGDQILFLPTIKTIKSTYPDSEITFVTEPRSKSFSNLTGLIDETIICEIKSGNKYKNIIDFVFNVRSKKFDMVISSGSSQQVAILLFLTGIKKRIGYNSGLLSKILLSRAIPLNKNQYAAKMYHDLISSRTSLNEPLIPEISVPEKVLEKYSKLAGKDNKKTIVIHPGVSKLSIEKNILKFWKTSNWVELIKKLVNTGRYKIILTGGPDDEEISAAMKQSFQDDYPEDLIDLTNKTSNITELAAIIKTADVLVCVDSAPMHIGVGTKTPTVALFGPTDEKKLFPVEENKYIVVSVDNLECRPCLWEIRETSCKNPVCLDIPVEKVFDAVEKLLNDVKQY